MISRIVTYIGSGIFAGIFLISGLALILGFVIGSAGVLFGEQPSFGEFSLFGTLLILFSLNLFGLILLGVGAPFFISILLELRLIKYCKSEKIELRSLRFKHPYSCRELHDYTSDVSDAWIATEAGGELRYFVLALKRIANFSFFSLIIIFVLVILVSSIYSWLSVS